MGRQLEDRIALITGANRGIGLAVAKAYAAEGARCILAGRNVAALESAARALGNAAVLPLDLEKPEAIRAAARSIAKLDILVANAAVLGARVPLKDYPFDVWLQAFQTNVHANLLLLQGLDAPLRNSDAGRVVVVTTGAARTARPGGGSYAVTKAALEMMAAVYAQEVTGTPIRINMVNPGPTRTAMRAQVAPKEDPMTLKTPEDIAPLFVELGSPGCTRQAQWIDAEAWLKSLK
ncbi:MAG TPA: SDR family NAD(P)-dependent oxidoreductase [Burkholderiales bacterium]|jgi:NAD(P)-dependent dehydrogenase (short-subunit alcohol dehydrogenase family)|nr:SDR family NAD(P)-dependent oxidoreductase [Burkholderiales bacterium]